MHSVSLVRLAAKVLPLICRMQRSAHTHEEAVVIELFVYYCCNYYS